LYNNGAIDKKTSSNLACRPHTTLKQCPIRSDGGFPSKFPSPLPPLATHLLNGSLARRFRRTWPEDLVQH
jgi:hypothetical protein